MAAFERSPRARAAPVLAATASGTQGGSAASPSGNPTAAAFPEVNLPFNTGSPGGKGTANVTVEPGLIGCNSVQAVVLDAQGGIATVPEVRMTFTLPGKGIGSLDAKLKNKGGYFGSDTLNLPFPGTWRMAVTIRTSDTDQATATINVTISRSRPVSRHSITSRVAGDQPNRVISRRIALRTGGRLDGRPFGSAGAAVGTTGTGRVRDTAGVDVAGEEQRAASARAKTLMTAQGSMGMMKNSCGVESSGTEHGQATPTQRRGLVRSAAQDDSAQSGRAGPLAAGAARRGGTLYGRNHGPFRDPCGGIRSLVR
jgi:hypothetical protein